MNYVMDVDVSSVAVKKGRSIESEISNRTSSADRETILDLLNQIFCAVVLKRGGLFNNKV
jgi:hypothetical protein